MKEYSKKDDLPIIVLNRLEGNPPAERTAMQNFLNPYVNDIIIFWWIVWVGVALFILSKYILKPLFVRYYK